jgi:hypothetical protein
MKLYLPGVIIIAGLSMSAQSKIPTEIDGDLNDWNLPLRYLNIETKLNYFITNDDSAFYVSIRVVEDQMIMRLLNVGFQISLNPTGKKKEAFDLQFNPQNNISALPPGKHDIEEIMDKFRQTPIVIRLNGFSKTSDDIYLASTLKSIQFAMNLDSLNILNIECRIPFSEMNYQLSEDEIALGIILFAMEPPSGKMQPPPGMDGPPAGMSPPQDQGFPPNGRTGFEAISEKSIWMKIIPMI